MKDADGKVIYVGKAVILRNRLRSYFHSSAQEDRKTRKLVSHIAEIEWIVVGSELEALTRERELILQGGTYGRATPPRCACRGRWCATSPSSSRAIDAGGPSA